MQSTRQRRLVLQQQHRQSVSSTTRQPRQQFVLQTWLSFALSFVTSSNTRTTPIGVGKSGYYISFSLNIFMTSLFPIVLEVHHEFIRRTLHNRCFRIHEGHLDCWRLVHRYQGSSIHQVSRSLHPQVRGGRSHD
jgi:hypothetical protein